MTNGNCALCKEYTELCNSHLIPRAISKKVKNHNGQCAVVNPIKNSTRFGQPNYSEYLLCTNCEEIIKQYEDYGVPFFRGKKNTHLDNHGITFNNIDHTLLKLYLTSIIWRASVSSIFENIKFSQKLEEECRLSLLNSEPLNNLGCLVTKITDEAQYGGQGKLKNPEEITTTPFYASPNRVCLIIEGFMFEFYSSLNKYEYVAWVLSAEKTQTFPYTLFDKIPFIDNIKEAWNNPKGKLKNFE